MSWDEALFKGLYDAARGALRRAEPPHAARAAELQPRLQLLASLLSGERVTVQVAEGEGGWRGDVILVPATIAAAPSAEGNVGVYLLRVAYACTSRQLGFTAEGDAVARALRTLLAVAATRAALLATLPGARPAEAAARAAVLAARPAPPRGAAGAALEALLRLHLGSEATALASRCPPAALAWARAAAGAAPRTPAELDAAATAFRDRLPAGGRGAVPAAVPLWGWLLPAAPARPAAPPRESDAAADLPSGSQRPAPPREGVEEIELPADPAAENPLVHSFEKVHTLESYRGGRKRVDASDEMAAHGDALDELELRQVVRSARAAASIYQADVLFRDIAERDAGDGPGLPYDEWDEATRSYRRAWCRVRPTVPAPRAGAEAFVAAVRRRQRRHIDALRAVFERAEAARAWRFRQPDGPDIDVDAVIDRYARLRAGHCAQDKLYAARRRHSRDVAVLLLLDASLSTDGWVANRRVMDVEQESVVVVGEALAGLYDEVGIAAFYSRTRRDCRFLTLKGFCEPWPAGYARLWAVEPSGYTRIGPALRHGTELLLRTRARKRLLLLVSDGKPTDLDRYEGHYGIADIRHAVREAEAVSVETVALAVDHRARLYLPRMFGAARFAILPSPAHLADAMARVCLTLLR
jgi:nitric oxide reductase activation protein